MSKDQKCPEKEKCAREFGDNIDWTCRNCAKTKDHQQKFLEPSKVQLALIEDHVSALRLYLDYWKARPDSPNRKRAIQLFSEEVEGWEGVLDWWKNVKIPIAEVYYA